MKQIQIYYVFLFLCIRFKTANCSSDQDLIMRIKHKETNKEIDDLNRKFIEMANKLRFYHEDINNFVTHMNASIYCDFYNEIKNYNLLCFCDLDGCPSNKTVTLFNKNLLKYKRLYNAVATNNYDVDDKVIVCLPNNGLKEIESLKVSLQKEFSLSLKFPDKCENGVDTDTSVMAIVTPSPYRFTTEVPTIIYNDPYFKDTDDLPNAMNLMTNWKPLKYAIVKFMKSMQWNRVAVVTDDKMESQEFLNDLVPFLNHNGIIYTSQMCNKKDCNFRDAAGNLYKSEAKIVILNINHESVGKIIYYMNHNSSRSVIWFVRDWPFEKNREFQPLHDLFSFTLSPVYDNKHQNIPYISGIMKSLKIIERQYYNAHGDRELFFEYFSREYKKLKPKTYVHIVRKLYNYNFKVVSTMHYTGTGMKEIQRAKIYNTIPEDILSPCLVKSNNYSRSCDDELFLIYLCVMVMFILIFLIVLIYFTRIRSNVYRRLF